MQSYGEFIFNTDDFIKVFTYEPEVTDSKKFFC